MKLVNTCAVYGLDTTVIRVLTTFYRPPTKLREGNVFTRVCHSVQVASDACTVGNIRSINTTLVCKQDINLAG